MLAMISKHLFMANGGVKKEEIQCTTFFMTARIALIGGIFRLTGLRSRSSHRWFESKDNRSRKKASCQPLSQTALSQLGGTRREILAAIFTSK